uniref:Putative ovule protein n=1 Tax=Solanum chacoense TaxID=4108 RepID=A0A0V0INP6_SOLCH
MFPTDPGSFLFTVLYISVAVKDYSLLFVPCSFLMLITMMLNCLSINFVIVWTVIDSLYYFLFAGFPLC